MVSSRLLAAMAALVFNGLAVQPERCHEDGGDVCDVSSNLQTKVEKRVLTMQGKEEAFQTEAGEDFAETKSNTVTGTVKWFNEEKGYGFILSEDGTDVFVHYRDIEGEGFKTLKEGVTVEFVISQGPRGRQAEHVRVIG
mmetsp:Transcript_79772/g.222037  ORF Transcript_79772/g.222037 Transcript_79772/m.222037 type:complete len:139 (+) Transcript_79772:85-501(+)